MDSAKKLAKTMADAVNIQDGFLTGLAQGVISFPVDLYYLGYDFIDTEHRYENSDDKYRFVRLIKAGTINRRVLEKKSIFLLIAF